MAGEPTTPETPPVAPAAAPVTPVAPAAAPAAPEATPPAPDAVTPGEPKVPDLQQVAERGILAYVYDEFLGGDAVLQEYWTNHKDDFDKMLNTYLGEKQVINSREQLASLNIYYKIAILLKAMVSGEVKGAAATLKLPETFKRKTELMVSEAFKEYWAKPEHTNGPTFEGERAYWGTHNVFDGMDLLLAQTQELSFEDWPKLLSPAGTRVALGKAASGQAVSSIADGHFKDIYTQAGLKLTVVKAGEAPKDPAVNEVQIVEMPAPKTWAEIQAAAPYWTDATFTQYSDCPEMCAAQHFLAAKTAGTPETPEAACAAVGYEHPDAKLIELLKTEPNT